MPRMFQDKIAEFFVEPYLQTCQQVDDKWLSEVVNWSFILQPDKVKAIIVQRWL